MDWHQAILFGINRQDFIAEKRARRSKRSHETRQDFTIRQVTE
jgi:hypothetical protein